MSEKPDADLATYIATLPRLQRLLIREVVLGEGPVDLDEIGRKVGQTPELMTEQLAEALRSISDEARV